MIECIRCGNKATLRITPDLDIRGMPVCKDCKTEVLTDMYLAFTSKEAKDWFEKKYNLK